MAEMSKSERADMIFKSLCNLLTNNNLQFKYNEKDRAVDLTFKGEDIPIEIFINVDEARQIVRLYSPFPFTMPEDKRVEGAIAACAYSYNLVGGNFDFNMDTGKIDFRVAQCFINRTINDDLFIDMITMANTLVEAYNDKFFMLSKGMLSIDEILNSLN